VEIKQMLLNDASAENARLAAHWPLDEGAGIVATDLSGNGYTGSILNGATWGSDAVRGSYVSFDGEDDRISTTFRYALSASDDFTWAWWANKQTAEGTDDGAIMVGNRYPEHTSNRYKFIKFTPQGAQFANTSNAVEIEKYNYDYISANEWHHYAMVKTGTECQWYVDGVAHGTPITCNYSESVSIPFLIAGDDDGSGTKVNEHFQGFIDDVVLYRSALTPKEVASVMSGVYNHTIEHFIHYPLDGNMGDAGDDGYDGTLVGGSFAPSLVKHGQGLVLDGIDDCAEITDCKGVTGTRERTCSAWVKTTQASPADFISWGASDIGARWSVGMENGVLSVRVDGGSMTGSIVINDGLWHHVAVTWKAGASDSLLSNATLYVDSRQESVSSISDVEINTGMAEDVHIGKFENADYFQGQIDDVRVYPYVLAHSELSEMATIEAPGPDVVADSFIDSADLTALAQYWLEDDCYSTNLCDGRDFNADQLVNQRDFEALSQMWLTSLDRPVAVVDDFESYALDTVMNNQTSPGLLGGLWDSDDEGTWNATRAGKVILDGDNQVVYQEYKFNGRRTLCVNGLTDPIEEGEAGILFFRFMCDSSSANNMIDWYAGVHDLVGDDPLTTQNADETGKINAGFRAYAASGATFDIQTVNGLSTLMTDLARNQWYSVWLVVDNGADTFDLYVEEAADGSGEAGEPSTDPIATDLTFGVSTANAITGGIWHIHNGVDSNVKIDDVAWSGQIVVP